MTITPEQAEKAVRRLARQYGFDVIRSHHAPGPDNLGGLAIVNMASGEMLAGAKFQLDLQDVARWLQRRHILGRN
jgi:hypothetical protein